MFPINQKLTRLDLAFPANVSHLMPPRSSIPATPEQQRAEGVASRWFFEGLKEGDLKAKPGVDETKALAHITCILRSFEPKHERKIAAVGFLINEWFTFSVTS